MIPQFKVGERVLCIDSYGWGIELLRSKTYEVLDVSKDKITLGFIRVNNNRDTYFSPDRFVSVENELFHQQLEKLINDS